MREFGAASRRAAVAAMAACACVMSLGQAAQAGEIRLLCIPGLRAVMEELLPGFERSSGQKVDVSYEIYAKQKQRVEAGDFDVAIFAQSQMAELAGQQKVVAGSNTDLAATSIGVAVRAGAPKPDIGDEQKFKAAMLAAKSITYTKESATGVYLTGLFDRLGLTPLIKDKLLLQSGGAMTTPAVAAGKAEIGIVLVSDIMATPGVELDAPLPPALQNQVMQTAAIGSKSENQVADASLIKLLASPSAAAVFRAKGLSPPHAPD